MNKNKDFDEKIFLINHLVNLVTDYFYTYMELHEAKEKYNKIVSCEDVWFINYTCIQSVSLILLIKYTKMPKSLHHENAIFNMLIKFLNILNSSLYEGNLLKNAEKVSKDVQYKEGTYVLLYFYIIINSDNFTNNYLKYIENKDKLNKVNKELEKFLTDERVKMITDLIEKDNSQNNK